MADFTKTGFQNDEWAVVPAATMRKGEAFDIPDDIEVAVEIAVCKVEAVAHDGEAFVVIEVSGNTTGDEDWTELMITQINAETAAVTTLDAEAAAAATTIPLTATTNFETKGDKFFIKNGTIANSEIVRNNGFSSGANIIILDGLTNTQQNGVSIFTSVEQFAFTLPSMYKRGRVLINNKDADCDIVSRIRLSKVTDLE